MIGEPSFVARGREHPARHDPVSSEGEEVGGDETERISGELDVVAAASGLSALARRLGVGVQALSGADAERLRDAVRSTRFELLTGKDDRLLRRLELEADVGLDVPADLRRAPGNVVGARIEFLLAVTDPNEPVTVRAP